MAKTRPSKPKPSTRPEPATEGDCDPVPAKNPKGGSNKPACPEVYPDRQPTSPPAEDPEQAPH